LNISIVIPVYNEAGSLPQLQKALHDVFHSQAIINWEVIYVDDGSSDASQEILEKFARDDIEHTRVVELSRNYGQTAAIAAGIDYAQGQIILFMDADLQNDPEDIPMMLDKLDQGYDVVSGWRVNRQDKFLTRRLPSRIANWLISMVTGVKLHDYGCTLKAYRSEVLSNFRLYGEMHRFIPAYASSVGAKIAEVPVQHHPRRFGETKYGLSRSAKVILDLFTVKFLMSYANKPIYLFGGTGILLIIISLLSLLFLVIRKYTVGIIVLSSPIFILSIILFILGFQSILMGMIAELLVRTYHESTNKSTYTIQNLFNFQSQKEA
jgi:glycosyltransferase involved in cell wall biosynthesis